MVTLGRKKNAWKSLRRLKYGIEECCSKKRCQEGKKGRERNGLVVIRNTQILNDKYGRKIT